MKPIRSLALCCALGLAAAQSFAAEPSPAGLWRTLDDKTHEPAALIRIVEKDGQFEGQVVKVLPRKGVDSNPLCDKCEGARKNLPVAGMTVLWGLKREGDEYAGGEILDPDEGSVYRCKLRLEDEGRKLAVRGYLGFSLFGRTQTWTRENE